MKVPSKPIRVLRLWYRLMTTDEAKALPHPAHRWLCGVALSWTGFNNGVIEFTRRKHGAAYRLQHPEVFEAARSAVLATGLVLVTREGKAGMTYQYALATIPIQARSIQSDEDGTPDVPPNREKLGTPDVPCPPKNLTPDVP